MIENPIIVILDGQNLNPGDLDWSPLKNLGDLEVFDYSSPEEVVPRSLDADILVVNKVRLDAEVLSMLPRLKMIAITATGYDNVDVGFARTNGIVTSNAVNYSTDSVVQYVISCIFHSLQGIDAHDQSVRAGEWSRRGTFSYTLYPIEEWKSKTIGVIGLGNIGSALAELASSMGMEVLAWNRSKKTLPSDIRQVELDELLSSSSIVSLHLPLNADTKYLIGKEAFSKMKTGAVLINAGRGALVYPESLLHALDTGKISRAYLDVLEKEPPDQDDQLVAHPKVIVTPHMAWCSVQARQNLMLQTAENIKAFLEGKPLRVL